MIGTFSSLALLFDGPGPGRPGTGARRIPGLVREDGLPAESAAAAGTGIAAGKGPTEGQERSHN
ncbi:hypothetical protein [Streptomyces sp. 2132.2]|uniref:hypothetical protein n=1 Tax=Streptomyces sp. 2132.2 TaxID=2485161 RepID=UPI000F498C10|nr:hypothetical protein [Streptomyces sp. 2132.2]